MFRAEAKGRILHFDTGGIVGGNEVFRDRETGSRWQQSTATAISGPLRGATLQLYPFLLTTWGAWKKLHPKTLVLKPLPGYTARLGAMNRILAQGITGGAGPPAKGAFGHDNRLPPRMTVVGLEVGGVDKAYEVAALNRVHVLNDRVGGVPVLMVHQPASDTTTAFVARIGNERLRFEAADAAADRLRDLETHSLWNAYGLCLAGEWKGRKLHAIILEPEFWFAWSEFHPGTLLYKGLYKEVTK